MVMILEVNHDYCSMALSTESDNLAAMNTSQIFGNVWSDRNRILQTPALPGPAITITRHPRAEPMHQHVVSWPSIPPFELLSVLAPSNNFDGHHDLAQHFTPWLGGWDDVNTQAPSLSVLLFSSRGMDTASLRLATRT